MIDSKLKLRVLFAIASCLVLVLAPLPARAQLGGVVEGTKHGIQKGAHGVQKGVETGAEKTSCSPRKRRKNFRQMKIFQRFVGGCLRHP